MNCLEVNNVVKSYAAHVALNDVSITVPNNTVFGLLGPNGAGKTSLIRIINQITAPDSGEVLLYGQKLKPNDIEIIGYLPEERGLYKKMKVGEQALYLAQLKGVSKKDAMTKLKYWFEKFEIQEWWNKRVEELSKGMQQKVQFIVTVLHDPKLLIFDEPFSGFDPINTNLIRNEMLKLKENGATIILSTHNMNSVEELCDNIALINKSKLILSGHVDEIRNSYRNNTFQIEYDSTADSENIADNGHFDIMEKTTAHNKTILKVQNHAGYTQRQLLTYFLEQVNIIAFYEIFPSMNDVFINCVSNAGKSTSVSL